MSSLQLDLTIEEANLILESLGEQPYIKVHQLIARIHQQAASQLQSEPTPPSFAKNGSQTDEAAQNIQASLT